jgi:hypothetical protein
VKPRQPVLRHYRYIAKTVLRNISKSYRSPESE